MRMLGAGALFVGLCLPGFGGVRVLTLTPSASSPQAIGTSVTWTVKAIDSNPGPLTFQFNVAALGGPFSMVKDFNVGKHLRSTWAPPVPFVWTPTGPEGSYQIQVVVKDFASGETASKTVTYQVNPLVTGTTPVVAPTANTLVALFSAPACPAGSMMRVMFQQQSMSTPATNTNMAACDGVHTMTFEVAGMYPSTTYNMLAQTITGSTTVNGLPVSFTTGAIPSTLKLATFDVLVPSGPTTDVTDSMVLHSILGGAAEPPVATDLAGNIMWYHNAPGSVTLLTRPLANGTLLTFQSGTAWNSHIVAAQLLRQADLAGNIIHETNTGILQEQLLAMGVTDAQACDKVSPPPVGSACLGAFSHDAIQTLPGGYTAVQADIEKIFPPGTQGDTSGLPVDVVGDIIIVLNQQWQVVWYFDAFEHAGGAPELDITRAALLNEICTPKAGCPFTYLLGTGVSRQAKDWLHGNTIYYWPQDGALLWSSRNQDWVMKIDYNNGTGTGNILWRMGREGDFQFRNIYKDPWPWFSGQHEVGMENNGSGPLSVFDNGNSRLAPRPLGLGKRCGPSDCYSRGMALNVDEAKMVVTPVLSVDLGVFSTALGSAQLLEDGKYFFQPGQVTVSRKQQSFAIEVAPTVGTSSGTQVLDMEGPVSYRAWQIPSLYAPPVS